ncbi:class I SAM-dependent methyltransferase [Cryptosporangium sp. NPDC051539]|uniref:class I SAM-dependent methyltransferase n=1 Tax=Cryptosporangium sp. NPDC051539 TaxID=3363962 RepID=UPI0037A67B74
MTAPAAVEMRDRDEYAVVAGLYDVFAVAQGEAALPRIPAFANRARPGWRVLDVGAGTGRVALAVAGRGATVHCLEPSSSMRSALLAKVAARPALWPRITVVAGQAPEITLPGPFDYAYLAGSLQFLTADQRRATFRALAERMPPDAVLALDMVDDTVAEYRPDPAGVVVAEARIGDSHYRMHAAVTDGTGDAVLITYRYETTHQGRTDVQTLRRRRYFHLRDDVHADLRAAGFTPDPHDPPDAGARGDDVLTARRTA